MPLKDIFHKGFLKLLVQMAHGGGTVDKLLGLCAVFQFIYFFTLTRKFVLESTSCINLRIECYSPSLSL
jgi:hypothetical protein